MSWTIQYDDKMTSNSLNDRMNSKNKIFIFISNYQNSSLWKLISFHSLISLISFILFHVINMITWKHEHEVFSCLFLFMFWLWDAKKIVCWKFIGWLTIRFNWLVILWLFIWLIESRNLESKFPVLMCYEININTNRQTNKLKQ